MVAVPMTTYGRAFSPERHLIRARSWMSQAMKRKSWLNRAPYIALAWGYLRLAADAVERMPEPET